MLQSINHFVEMTNYTTWKQMTQFKICFKMGHFSVSEIFAGSQKMCFYIRVEIVFRQNSL